MATKRSIAKKATVKRSVSAKKVVGARANGSADSKRKGITAATRRVRTSKRIG